MVATLCVSQRFSYIQRISFSSTKDGAMARYIVKIIVARVTYYSFEYVIRVPYIGQIDRRPAGVPGHVVQHILHTAICVRGGAGLKNIERW